MTPSGMGALIAVWLTGVPDEAAGEPPAAKMNLTEPFTAGVKGGDKVPTAETLPATEDRAGRVGREPETVVGEAATRSESAERCRDGEPASPRSGRPEPTKMQLFAPGQIALRWTPQHGRLGPPRALFQQSGTALDLRLCLPGLPVRAAHAPADNASGARK
jgi:hypothetical protein